MQNATGRVLRRGEAVGTDAKRLRKGVLFRVVDLASPDSAFGLCLLSERTVRRGEIATFTSRSPHFNGIALG